MAIFEDASGFWNDYDYEDDSGFWDDSGSRSSTRGFADLAVGAGVDEWVTTNQGFARR